MGVLEYSVWINATPDWVSRKYVEPARIPDWQTDKKPAIEIAKASLAPGSTYTSRRRPLVARRTVLTADAPKELRTRVDAFLSLQLEVTSRLIRRSGVQAALASRYAPRRTGAAATVLSQGSSRCIPGPPEAQKKPKAIVGAGEE